MQTESLPVILTEAEMAVVATELGELETELTAVKEAKKAAAKNFKEDIDRIQMQIDMKAQIATSGQEYRPVECDWIPDYTEGLKRLIRRDTGHEVRNIHLTDEERQTGLFDEVIENTGDVAEPNADIPAMEPEDGSSTEDDRDADFINKRNRGRRRPAATRGEISAREGSTQEE